MELSEIQKIHEHFVRERGWDRFPDSLVCLHLTEEISEIASHILFKEGYKKEGMGNSRDKKEIAEEFAQAFSLLLQLASSSGIDMEEVFLSELERNRKRFPAHEWKEYMAKK